MTSTVIGIVGVSICAAVYFMTGLSFFIPMAWGFILWIAFTLGYALGGRDRD